MIDYFHLRIDNRQSEIDYCMVMCQYGWLSDRQSRNRNWIDASDNRSTTNFIQRDLSVVHNECSNRPDLIVLVRDLVGYTLVNPTHSFSHPEAEVGCKVLSVRLEELLLRKILASQNLGANHKEPRLKWYREAILIHIETSMQSRGTGWIEE